MTKWAGMGIALCCAACGLEDSGIFDGDAGLDAPGASSSSFIDGSLSGELDAAPSSSTDAGGGFDGADASAIADAKLVDVDAMDGTADAGEVPVDAGGVVDATAVDACVPPPIDWVWTCNGQSIGAGDMCVESSTGSLAVRMPFDCRACMSVYTCACILAHFGEENACGIVDVDGGNMTVAPASCTDLPDAGQLVVCP